MPILMLRRDHDLVAAPAGIQERMFLECQRRQLDDDVGVADRRCFAGSATALNCCRRLTRLVASTVVEIVTAAVVCLLWTIRSAIVWRIELTAISSVFGDEAWRRAAGRVSGVCDSVGLSELCSGGGADVALDDSAVFATSLPVRSHRRPARGRCAGRAGEMRWLRPRGQASVGRDDVSWRSLAASVDVRDGLAGLWESNGAGSPGATR